MSTWQESDLRKRKEIAEQQLKEWEAIALKWPLYRVNDGTQTPVRCEKCGQSVWFVNDLFGNPYQYSESEILALTVAHIRQRHEEVINEGHEG